MTKVIFAIALLAIASPVLACEDEAHDSVVKTELERSVDRFEMCVYIEGPHGDLDKCAKWALEPLGK